MIKRNLEKELIKDSKEFPVLAVIGPRQSGKTTLTRAVFANHKYVSLENPINREFARSAPVDFFKRYKNEYGIILDEIQNVPELLSFIQGFVDENKKPGEFILTGSQNFLINEAISQTLAGRISIHTLLPLSIEELKQSKLIQEKDAAQIILQGQYPGLYDVKRNFSRWYINYIQTYVERDVRLIKNIVDLSMFQKFMRLCAGRIGQILNVVSLSNDLGVSTQTVKEWLSILEQSYIVFLLQPHFNNFGKRLIKSPKLYFYDTGLACSLLGINTDQDLQNHYIYGNLFESFIISDLFKKYYNKGLRPAIYFWRDSAGHEVDCILENGLKLSRIEIKSTSTINSSVFSGLDYWNSIAKGDDNSYLVYSGDDSYKRGKANVVSWRDLSLYL